MCESAVDGSESTDLFFNAVDGKCWGSHNEETKAYVEPTLGFDKCMNSDNVSAFSSLSSESDTVSSVSYTHLTLPTKRIV